MFINPHLTDLLARQHGVATREQLLTLGCPRGKLRAEIESRRWRELNDHVVVTHNGPLTRRQQLWAVVLSAQRPAALCSLSVMELMEVRGFADRTVHAVVRRGARVLEVPGVQMHVHESRRFDRGDIYVRHDGLPVTYGARSFVDAAIWSPDAITAHRVLVAGVQQRRLSPKMLLAELERAGRVQHSRTLRQLLQDLEGGAEALSEVEFLRFCRRHSFPRPKLQHRLDSRGRRRYLDAEFKGARGRSLLSEIDGGVHLNLSVRWKDTIKDNDAWLAQQLVLRFPSVAIYTDHPDAVRQLTAGLELVST